MYYDKQFEINKTVYFLLFMFKFNVQGRLENGCASVLSTNLSKDITSGGLNNK